MVNGLPYIHTALLSESLYNIASHCPIHTHIRTQTAVCQPCKATASSSSEAVSVRWCLAQGHLNT